MSLLQFWPSQSHYLLDLGDRTLSAGEIFEASKKDAEELLGSPDIRKAPDAQRDEVATSLSTQSPDRAERTNPTT